jgi:hypothetical protein
MSGQKSVGVASWHPSDKAAAIFIFYKRQTHPYMTATEAWAPTEGQNIKKTLANEEPSTHVAKRTSLPGPPKCRDEGGHRNLSTNP